MELPNLRPWRLRRALGQRDLATASKVGTSTINRLERGLQLARPITARKLAAALGISVEELQALSSETEWHARSRRTELRAPFEPPERPDDV